MSNGARVAIPMLVLFAAGCGNGVGDVTGKVTYNKRPVVSGTVMLLASDGQPYDGAIDAAGNYLIRKVPTGPARIAVSSILPIANKEPRESKASNKTDTRLMAIEEAKAASSAKTTAIPSRYGNFAASSLAVTIASGQMTHDIELGD